MNFQATLPEQSLVDPVLVSLAALAVSISSAVFTAWWNIRQDRKNRGKISAFVDLSDGYGGSPTLRGKKIFDAEHTTSDHLYFVIEATNTGHRPVSLKGVYARTGLPFFKKQQLSANIITPRLDEAETTWIYVQLPPDAANIRSLIVHSAKDNWPVDRQSLRRSLALLSERKAPIAKREF